MMGHQSFLYPNLTARENLEFYAELYSLPILLPSLVAGSIAGGAHWFMPTRGSTTSRAGWNNCSLGGSRDARRSDPAAAAR